MEEAQAMISLLGQLPTSSNAHDLYIKLLGQTQEQTAATAAPQLRVVEDIPEEESATQEEPK